MDPRTRNVFAIVLLVLVGLAGVSVVLLGETRVQPPDTKSVEGIIVAVDSAGLTDVRSFDLRTADGTTMTFSLERLENGATFPPGHLVEHQAGASPVRVWYTTDGEVRYAIRLEDVAPAG